MKYQITVTYSIKNMGDTIEHETTLYRTIGALTEWQDIERECKEKAQRSAGSYWHPVIVSIKLTPLKV